MINKFKNIDKKTKVLIEIIVISLIITLTSTSWAFFSVSGIPQGKDTVITTGTMRLEFSDGKEVIANNLTPGHSISKTFKVKNIGNVDTIYNIYLSEVINTFLDKDDLVYSLESSSCDNVDEVIAPSESGETIVSNCQISPNQEHSYTLNILFKETNNNQNDNTGKSFSAKISVNDFDVSQGIAVANSYIEEANKFYILNNSSSELGTNLASELSVDNKLSSDKVIITKDGKVELAIKRDNLCFRKYATSDDINVIENDLCNANINNFVSNNGQLHVTGTKLLNERNEEVRLVGGSGGDYGSYIYSSKPQIDDKALISLKSWGGNVFRAFVHTRKSCELSYIDHEEEYINYVKTLIDNAIENDMYVILNWDPDGDVNNDGNNPFTSYAVDFFTRIATLYPNDPHLIYEPWNEPLSSTTYSTYSNHMNTVIPAIREISPDALIFTSFKGSITDLKNNLLSYNNIMYVVHNYMNDIRKLSLDKIQEVIDLNIPIVVTEWGGMGIGSEYQSENIIEPYANEYLKFLNKNNLSYTYHRFGAIASNDDMQYGIVKRGKWRSDLGNDILTTNGRFLKSILSNNYLKEFNVLMENNGDFWQSEKHGHTYRSVEWKDKIESIEFSDVLNVPGDATITWDLSFSQNNSVIGYLIPSTTSGLYKLTIAANGKIYSPINMEGMFANMSKLRTINFDNLVVENVTTMAGMFYEDNLLQSLDLSTFDVSKLKQINSAFFYCTNLKFINFDNWKTAKIRYITSTFHGCSKLQELDLRGFDVSLVEDFGSVFADATNLKRLDISTWNPKNVKSLYCTFRELKNLEMLDMSSLNVQESTPITNTLKNVKAGARIYVKNQFVKDKLSTSATNELNYIIKE